MKALAPVLKFHFWILLGFGLILAIAGWWMTTTQMQAATATRRDAIQKATEKLPKGDVPSKDWADKLQAINADQEVLLSRSRDFLYSRQKERMVWPEVLSDAAAKLKYRADFNDPILQINYRDNYYKEVDRVYKIPRPIDSLDDSGVVVFPFTLMPHKEWGDITPTSQQMWDSMEDLWLLEPILQAILETNGGETATRHDALIVAIEYLRLKGGDRSKIGQVADAGGGAGAGGAGGMPGMPAGGGGPAGAFGDAKAGGGDGATGVPGGGNTTISTDIPDTEELGDPGQPAQDAGGGGAGMPGGAGGAMPMGDMPMGGGRGKTTDEDVGRRYIDDDPALPYRTRGFKLTVVMDHRKVPELYAQLTSSERSPWPIQILRLNIARFSDSGAVMGDVAGGGMGAGAGAGFGGGARAGFGGPPMGAGLGGAMPRGKNMRERRRGGDEDEMNFNGTTGSLGAANDQMANPFLSRVTLIGLITLYNEPPPSESAAGTTAAPIAESAGEALPGATPTSDEPTSNGLPDSATLDGISATETPEGEAKPSAAGDDAAAAEMQADDTDKPTASPDDPSAEGEASPEKPASESEPGDAKPETETPSEDTPAGTEPRKTETTTEE